MRMDVSQIRRSPKSTVVGLCVLALAAEHSVHFDAVGHLAMTARDWFDVACGVLTAVVGGVSQDAERMPSAKEGETDEECSGTGIVVWKGQG